GWIVALADMPLVRPATIRAVADAIAAGAALAAPRYRGERGHPVGFAAAYGPRLAALSGDAGAREIVRAERERLRLIDCDDPGVLADIDTALDLERLRESSAS
ncbi:MAG TPA: NTP transferase domain-containing protein, partial [Burkholderiales bacterium]